MLESEFFKEGQIINPIGKQADINERAFKIKKIGTVSDVIAVNKQVDPAMQRQQTEGPIERCYVISLLEIKDDYLPELDEVRDEVEKDYRMLKAADVAKTKADQALNILKETIAAGTPLSATRTVDFESLTTKQDGDSGPIDGDYIRPTEIAEANAYVPNVGRSTALRKTAFALKPGQISEVIEVREMTFSPEGEPEEGDIAGFYIIQALGLENAGPIEIDERQERMETMWEQRAQSIAFNSWIDSISREATIELNNEVLWPSDLIDDMTDEEDLG